MTSPQPALFVIALACFSSCAPSRPTTVALTLYEGGERTALRSVPITGGSDYEFNGNHIYQDRGILFVGSRHYAPVSDGDHLVIEVDKNSKFEVSVNGINRAPIE
jgi:hypothetical protein